MTEFIEIFEAMECVILAGGKGRRLQPYTDEIPKPLVSLGDITIIEILIKTLKKHNISKIHIAVNHRASQITELLGDGSRLGVSILYAHEDKELSTVAPVKLIKNLPNNFLVVNGDIIADIDFEHLFRHHLQNQSLLTVAACNREHNVDYGVLELDEHKNIVIFKEKPKYNYLVSMGIYVFSKKIFEYIPDNEKFGFDDLMFRMLDKKLPINSYIFDGYWLDIGRPSDYHRALDQIDIINKIIE